MALKFPMTPAIRALKTGKVSYIPHLYAYENRGGTAVSSRALGVPEHFVIKTLVLENETAQPMMVLMHGDCEISTKKLARTLGTKLIRPCSPESAQKHTGYQVGGTSPFGTRKTLPVYVEESILDLETIFINGGKRGFLISGNPRELLQLLPKLQVVQVGLPRN